MVKNKKKNLCTRCTHTLDVVVVVAVVVVVCFKIYFFFIIIIIVSHSVFISVAVVHCSEIHTYSLYPSWISHIILNHSLALRRSQCIFERINEATYQITERLWMSRIESHNSTLTTTATTTMKMVLSLSLKNQAIQIVSRYSLYNRVFFFSLLAVSFFFFFLLQYFFTGVSHNIFVSRLISTCTY